MTTPTLISYIFFLHLRFTIKGKKEKLTFSSLSTFSPLRIGVKVKYKNSSMGITLLVIAYHHFLIRDPHPTTQQSHR